MVRFGCPAGYEFRQLKLFTFLFKNIIARILLRISYIKAANNVILPVARPFSILTTLLFVRMYLSLLQLPIGTNRYFLLGLKVLIPFFVIMILYKFVDVASHYLALLSEKTSTTLDDQLVPIARKAFKIIIIIGGSLFILQNLEFNITGLLAGISIGGLAFALAAQDTIKNLFGFLMIFVDRPFQMGDWIVTDGVNGTVEEVGFRSTRVRTFHNSVVSIPNGKIADMTVDNMGLRSYRRFNTNIGITYDTPTHLIQAFVIGLRKIVKEHPHTLKDRYEVYLNAFASSSLNILFYIFFSAPTWSEELRCRHEVILEIIKLAEHLQVRFAFPTQTLHIEEMPEKQSLTPIYDISTKELKQKIADFQIAAKQQPE